MEYIGIDLHKASSQVCIVNEQGEVIERRIRTERERFTEVLGARAPARVLLEASTESEWVAQHLEAMGHEVVVADPNYAPMYGTLGRRVKTDRRDAMALCEAARTGVYRAAHRTSAEHRKWRAALSVRETMVATRTKYINVVRSLLRQHGTPVRACASSALVRRVRELELDALVAAKVEPLLHLLEVTEVKIQTANRELEQLAERDATVQRLTTVPGVGAVTAATFVAVVDRAERFGHASQLRSYLGLVPSEYSSGESQIRGHLTKAGNRRLRSLLVEAAWCLLRHPRPETEPLRAWAQAIAVRRGKRIAAVALARKLAGVLYAMWRDGTSFGERRPRGEQRVLAA
jgi:transposase